MVGKKAEASMPIMLPSPTAVPTYCRSLNSRTVDRLTGTAEAVKPKMKMITLSSSREEARMELP